MAESTFERARFETRLTTRRLGRRLLARASVASTNDAAWEALASGAPDGTVVVADAQTQGRGRGGRRWALAPGRGLALSVLLTSGCDVESAAVAPLGAGLALARALEGLGVRAALKWPNDLLVRGRKLSGILCESRRAAGPAAGGAIVVGVGVNVGERAEDFPDELRGTATSLALEGAALDRETVAAEFLNALEPVWGALAAGERAGILAAWRTRASFWGEAVRVRAPGGTIAGIARGLDPAGGLVLALDDGREVTVVAGDLEIAGAGSAAAGGEPAAGAGR
ncbi:MAG TPA: biotin--[acetyl-CoA-carboxylase] ligase [Candidatus Eisenbacteria bacterium]